MENHGMQIQKMNHPYPIDCPVLAYLDESGLGVESVSPLVLKGLVDASSEKYFGLSQLPLAAGESLSFHQSLRS